MLIVNESSTEASWFCYNFNDDRKLIALASGNRSANGGQFYYGSPDNATGRYCVIFTVKGIPPSANKLTQIMAEEIRSTGVGKPPSITFPDIFGHGELSASGTIVMKGSGRPYEVRATDPYAAETGAIRYVDAGPSGCGCNCLE